jgi:GLPGLI family protein
MRVFVNKYASLKLIYIMKIIKKTLFICTLIVFTSVYSQFLKVEYQKIDFSNQKLNGTSQEFQNKINELNKIAQTSFLYYAEGNAFFKTVPKDSFTVNAGDQRKDERTVIHKREAFKDKEIRIYTPKNVKGIYVYYDFPDINDEFYGYADTKFAKIDYKDNTIIIDHYSCKLVEVSFEGMPEKIYKVWYTEDMPISAGPFGFSSFPGLVLRVESPDDVITVVKISNETKLSDVEKMNPKLKIYKNEELNQKMKEVMEKRSKTTTEEIRL